MHPVTPKEFYRGLALLEGRRPLLIPLPCGVALLGARALEQMGLRPSISSSTVLEAMQRRPRDVSQSTAAIGCQPMSKYLQSLERLAVEEGKIEAAKKIATLASEAR